MEFGAAGSVLRVFDWASRSWVNHGTSPGVLKDIKLLDMNGDGLKDVILEEPFSVIFPTPSTGIISQTFHLWMNSGLAFRPTSVSLTQSVDLSHVPAPDPLHISRAQPIDYDGDGREDLVFPAGILRLASPDQLEFTPIDFGYDAVTVADINGDSSPDLIEIKNGNETGTDPAAFGRTLTIRALGAARAGLLQTITDGYGKRISVSYDAHVRSPIAGDGGPPPVVAVYQTNGCAADSLSNCIQRVGPLVSAHDEAQVLPDGRANEGAQYRYFYFGARAGLGGRGWFGFSSRDIIETQAPDTDTSITYNNHDFALAGTVSSVQKIYFGSADANQFTNPVSFRSERSTFEWSSRSGEFTQFPVVNTETHAVFEGSATQPLSETRIDSTIDQFGTATSTTVTTTAGNGPTTLITSRDVNNDAEDWLLGQVSSVRTISLRDGLSATRTSHFTYEPGTNLISTIERQPDPRNGTGPDPNAPSEYQKTTFTREPNHGNVREVCISAAVPVAARCASVTTFDASDIFPTHTTDAVGLPSEAHFSPVDGKLVWARDANGLLTELGRDAFGRVVSVLSPTQEGAITYASSSGRTPGVGGISIWSAYSVTETFKGHGSATKFFDAFGNHTDTVSLGTDSKLIVSEREFDSTGHLRKAAAPHSAGDTSQGLTEYVYDGFGRLSSATDPVGSTTRYAYPNRMTALAGTVSSWFTSTSGLTATAATVVQKPRGNFEGIVRDPSGNPVASAEGSLADPVKPITRFRYHPFDVLFEIDSLNTTSIQSDGLGRVLQVDDPATGTEVNSYDGFDELIEHTSGNQNKTTREYDSDGRPTRLNDQNGALIAQWLYDGRNPDGSLPGTTPPNALGRLTATYRQAKPGAATGNWVGYQYQAPNRNNRGLLESITYGISGAPDDPSSGAQHFSIGFEYKADVPGQIDVVHYPEEAGGLQVQYSYAVSGAISSVFPAGDPTHPYWKLLELDQGFRPKTEALGNGLVTTRDYYSLTNGMEECAAFTDHSCLPGRLRAISIQKGDNASVLPIQNAGYAYDRNGNLAAITPSLAPIKELYDYDQFDRLVAHREQNPSPVVPTIEAFTYDSIGNLTSKTGVGSYTYGKPRRPFQVTEAGGVTYGYDDAGNQTTRSGTSIPGGSQTLEYNDFNMPYRITSGDNGSAGEVDFEYAAGGSRLVKRKLAGGNPSETTFDIGDLYEQVVHDSVGQAEPIDRTHLFRIFAGRQIAQISRVERAGGVLDDPKIVYLHDDHIGSTVLITDANGAVIDGRSYGSFGDETSAIDYAATGVLSGFTSQEHDADLGLVNMRGRLYDPRLGRFITPDPFVTRLSPQGFNRYSYVRNNPLTLVDPSGFLAECSYPGACGEDAEERAREEGEARGEAEAQAASEAAAQAAAAEHACDGGLCGGQAPNTLTDPTSNPGARSARDAELNWTAGSQGNPFRNPNRLAINTIDDEQGGIGSGGLPTAEIEGMGEAAGPGALDNLGEIAESVGKAFDDLFNAVERFVEELEQPKLGPRQAYVDAAGTGLGDLTAEEVEQIQSVVDEAGRPLDVVGSAARGGRNPASDIDYTTANANHQEFGDLARRLPGIDPDHGLLRGGPDPYEGPSIRFEPGEAPRFVPAAPR